jgi:hypothetical protein
MLLYFMRHEMMLSSAVQGTEYKTIEDGADSLVARRVKGE